MISTPFRYASAAGSGLDAERALEVVDDRQQILEQRGGRAFARLAPLALDPLPVVVELGRQAQQAVVIFVAFPLELCDGVIGGDILTGRFGIRRAVLRQRRGFLGLLCHDTSFC